MPQVLNVAVAGLGAAGLPVARALDRGIPGLRLAAVSAADAERARRRMADFRAVPPVLPSRELAREADVVVEALPPERFLDAAEPAVEAGRLFMPLTVTQLLAHEWLIDRAKETGARILIPTGALLGMDAIRAAAEGEVRSVRMITRKPPAGLRRAPGVAELGVDMDNLPGPVRIYEGSVREAARLFPANVNVSVAVSYAGIGVDRTRYEIWADPSLDRNRHTIEVDCDAAQFEMSIANVPSEENPATGKLTALSTIAALRALTSTLKVGS